MARLACQKMAHICFWVWPVFVCQSVCRFVGLFVCFVLFVCFLFVCLFVCLSVCLFVCLFGLFGLFGLFVCLFLFVCLSTVWMCACVSVCLRACMPACLRARLLRAGTNESVCCESKCKAPIHTLNPHAGPYPRSIPKRRWSRPFHTSGSPRADPYPNFDATPGHCGWELLGVWLQWYAGTWYCKLYRIDFCFLKAFPCGQPKPTRNWSADFDCTARWSKLNLHDLWWSN